MFYIRCISTLSKPTDLREHICSATNEARPDPSEIIIAKDTAKIPPTEEGLQTKNHPDQKKKT